MGIFHTDPLYVVTALHSTGHGSAASPVLVTSNPRKAIEYARRIELMAYEFNSEDGVTISKVKDEIVYDHQPGDIRRHHGNPTNQDALVYYRTLGKDYETNPPTRTWTETFCGEWEKEHP